MIALLPLLTLLLQSGSDLESAKRDFRQSVVTMDASGVRTAAERLRKADSRAAVDTLLDGCGVCAQQIKSLWGEKTRWKKEMEANSGYKIDYSKTPPQIEPGSVNMYNKFREAERNAQAVERKIMSVEAVRREITAALGGFQSDEAVRELLARLKSEPDWTRRAGIAGALGSIPRPETLDALLAQIPLEKEPGAKAAILDALRAAKTDDPRALSAASEALKDEYWQVQLSALLLIRDRGRDKAKTSIDALIEALQKSDGRMQHEINDALVALTGVDRHGDASAWKSWWDSNRESFLDGDFQPSPQDAGVAPSSATTFYGIPIKSKKVVFVLDRSGSMMEPSEWELPGGEDVSTGAKGKNEVPDLKPSGDRKIDIARWQLKRALAGMPDGAEFNIVFFNQDVSDATILNPKGLVKLSKATRNQAYAFIDATTPDGGTNIFDPMERALSFAGSGIGDKLYKSGADTIFLLTDGIPNSGQIPEPTEILVQIKELNATRKVKINTIGVFSSVGPGSMQPDEREEGTKFLQQMAEESGGVFATPPQRKK